MPQRKTLSKRHSQTGGTVLPCARNWRARVSLPSVVLARLPAVCRAMLPALLIPAALVVAMAPIAEAHRRR
jgi:hypothetical protein